MPEKEKSLINGTAVREWVKGDGEDTRIGEDFLDALNKQVKDLVEKALTRMEGNGRKTLKASDA